MALLDEQVVASIGGSELVPHEHWRSLGRGSRVVHSIDRWLSRVPLSLVQLLMRIGIGAVFFNAGCSSIGLAGDALAIRDRVQSPARRSGAHGAAGQPSTNWCSRRSSCSDLPRAWRRCRFFGMIVVIQTFVYPNAWIEHLVWTSILLFLLTRGGGSLSLDNLIAGRFALRRQDSPGHSTTTVATTPSCRGTSSDGVRDVRQLAWRPEWPRPRRWRYFTP